MKCLESMTFDRNVQVNYFSLDGCQTLKVIKSCCERLVELSIRACLKLKGFSDFRGLICVERDIFDECGKAEICCPNN